MTAHAADLRVHEHHGPPPAAQSSRVGAPTLGMLLFIASEVMLFGAFFTVYFFVRVVNPDVTSWPPEVEGHTYHLPDSWPASARRSILHVQLHDALGHAGDQARLLPG